MSRKLLNITLVVVLMLSIFTACASNNGNNGNNGNSANNGSSNSENKDGGNATETPTKEGEKLTDQYGDTGGLELPLVDKPTTITWMLVSENPANDKLIAKEIEKRTGITVDLQTVPPATYQDKLRVTMASGKLPDIFHGLKAAELKKMGQQGAVVAINDYLDMLPNFTKLYVEENPWVIGSYGDASGNIYTWPIYNMNRDVNFGYMYRKDIFDKHNIPVWNDTEGFYQALKQLKEIYPDSYPFALKKKAYVFRDSAYGWGIGGAQYPMYYDEADKTWKFASTQPENKEMLDFFKKLYNEGLLDPEFLTDTQDSWSAKMTTDKAFVTNDWIGRLDMFTNQVKETNPDYDLRYGFPVGPTGNERTLDTITAGFNIAVANNDNKEVALKLLDYLSSPSGGTLVTMGVEGETFTFDENGKPVYPELKDLPLVDIKVLEDKYGLWLEGMYLRPDRRSVYFNYTEREQEAQDLLVENDRREPLDPVLNFTDEETTIMAELQTSLTKAAEEFNSRYVLDKDYGDAEWEAWQQNAAKMGADQLTEVFNAAQKRLDATQ